MSVVEACYDIAHAAHRWTASAFREGADSYRAHEDTFQSRYRHRRGRSGRSYVFSVYAPLDCPAYEDAVVIVASRSGAGEALACVDLGPSPDTRLAKLRKRFWDRLDGVEFQIHVLAQREGDRLSLIADVAAAA